jgi:hypothetical protein
MKLFDKEHDELVAAFERFHGKGLRLDKESRDMWAKGYIYQNASTNDAFKFFRSGYALGKHEFQCPS